MLRTGWRRFKPRALRVRSSERDNQDSLFSQARSEVSTIIEELQGVYGGKLRYHHLEDRITDQRERAEQTQTALDLLVLLILQAPRAAAAQIAMDAHTHGYRDRHARLFELIDFNDSFDSTVLACADEILGTFVERAKKEMDWLCRRLKAQCFSDRQYEAIVHGLSREIAVFRGALTAGFSVRMTSRKDDAFGIDMVIGDVATGRELNVDCKTASSYFLRLQDLTREGRISAAEETQAEKDGFVRVVNRGDGRSVEVTILRIDSSLLGAITNFSFENPQRFVELLQRAFHS